MCHKIRLFNFHFKFLIIKYNKSKNSAKYHKILMRRFCLSNLKPALSRELPMTARKTVFSHLKLY